MMTNDFAFSYKPGYSVFHKCPAVIKLLLLPVLSILIFKLPVWSALFLFVSLLCCELGVRISFHEIFSDLKLILFYSVLLAVVSPRKETFFMLTRLLSLFVLASLFFRTSSSLQLRGGVEQIEAVIRRVFHLKPGTIVSQTLALVICFIPLVSKNWNQVKKAWHARGGKSSPKMYAVLLPIFFSVGMKQAWNTARAIAVRDGMSRPADPE